jgi:hypothetical protein
MFSSSGSPPSRGNKRQKTGRNGNGGDRGSKGKDMMGFEPATKDTTWITKSDHDPSFPLTPSTKTAALKAILLKGFADAPMDKVYLVFAYSRLSF